MRYGVWLAAPFGVAFAGLVLAILLGPVTHWVAGPVVHRLPDDQQAVALNHVRRTVLQSVGGTAALSALAFAVVNYRLNRRGQITERYTSAIGNLASDKLAERIGGMYALEHIMRESERDHSTVVEVLSAFIRENASAEDEEGSPPVRDLGRWMHPPAGTVDPPDESQARKRPATDIQTALTVIARRPRRPERNRVDLGTTNLRGADLRGAHLEQVDLRGAHLEHADLRGAHLEDANLRRAHLQHANLRRAHLEHADLWGAHLEHAYLGGAHLRRADLWGAHLEDANLVGAHLEHARLLGARLERAYLVGTHLEHANLRRAHLSHANLVDTHLEHAYLVDAHLEDANQLGAHMHHANLRGAHLERGNLGGAHLDDAYLVGAHLEQANLVDAHLDRADLVGAHLQRADLVGATLDHANLVGADLKDADLWGVDLSTVRGLSEAQLRSAITADVNEHPGEGGGAGSSPS
ncbi:pentapeptide repeat-containing protein [Nocardiopsis rhodophaea]|uniref:pentapeptide repeat-containing protein n=1 Tax=Nocardiopsis rhodophaea TaxID=280238 RepID=UPI0031DB2DD3